MTHVEVKDAEAFLLTITTYPYLSALGLTSSYKLRLPAGQTP